jgi:hypothetical protein
VYNLLVISAVLKELAPIDLACDRHNRVNWKVSMAMKKAFLVFLALVHALTLGLVAAEPAWPLPENIKRFFATQTLTEDGGLTGDVLEIRDFRGYVLDHWRELLDHAAELPRNQGLYGNTVGLIGGAAAHLPPTDYLEFVEKVIDLAEAKKIPKEAVFDQIKGENKKDGFMAWNWADPRVRRLVQRAQRLVSEKDKVTSAWLKDLLSGDLAKPENFFSGNRSDSVPPQETLPSAVSPPAQPHAAAPASQQH